MKLNFQFRKFQIEDLARAAMHDDSILSWDPGLGKTIAGIAWPIIKKARRVLIVAPGGLHKQWRKEAMEKFGIHISSLPDVRSYRAFRLDRPLRNDAGIPRFYITSYQDLGYNNADEWPDGVTETGVRIIKNRSLDPHFVRLQRAICALNGERFNPEKFFEGIGEERNGIRCTWQPTLARVIAASEAIGGGFDTVIVDEGTRLQANESHIGLGVRSLNPKNRLILTGTPIKNRLESFFWLAWWVCGGSTIPTARWPYEGTSEAREQFATQHLQMDRFITRETEAEGGHGNVDQDLYDMLQRCVVRGNGLSIPQQLNRRDYARVKKVIEAYGGRLNRKAGTHLFATTPNTAAGIHSVTTFLASLRPIVPGTGKKRRIEKRSARICNIHRLWKLIAPIVVRRRKRDCGEDIMPMTIKPIHIQPGTTQQAVYQFHLDNPPIMAKGTSTQSKLNARTRIGMQLGCLRQAALCPDTPDLAEVITDPHARGQKRSWTDANPKQAAILALTADLLNIGEQVIIGSPFTHFNQTLHRRLLEAGVASILLDGRMQQEKRGEFADAFKARRYSVMVVGLNSMAEGHSFECCSHLITPSLSWALDENEQFPQRVWRLNSPKPVTIYAMVMQNTIDERMLQLHTEKSDSSQLALDGKLIEQQVENVDLAVLLADAVRGFDPDTPTVDERDIEAQWHSHLRSRLGLAEQRFREFHPPIVGSSVTAGDVADAVKALALPSPTALQINMQRLRNHRRRSSKS